MSFLLHVTGPDLDQQFALDPSGAELTFGRDAAAGVQLADPDKHISRKHLAVRHGDGGVELRITSALNGVQTSFGPAEPGQRLTLRDGDHFTLGAYRVEVRSANQPSGGFGTPPAAHARIGADPFATLFNPAGSTAGDGSRAAHDAYADPFSNPDFHPAPPPRRPNGVAAPGQWAGRSQQLDAWLSSGEVPAASWTSAASAPPQTGPFDAFIARATNSPAPRALSPDHVHGIHLPMAFTRTPAGVVSEGQAPTPRDDIWAGLFDALTPSQGHANDPTAPASRADPFDDWDDAAVAHPMATPDSGSVPCSDANPAAPLPSPAIAAADPFDAFDAWTAFTRGLGLPVPHDANADIASTPKPNPQTGASPAARATHAEHVGTVVRTLVEALALLLDARNELKRELRAPDRTMLSGHDNNPLKAGLAAPELVQYLFAMHPVGGYLPAGRAVRESINDLLIHQHATLAATRAAVEGTLRDFDPARLRQQRLKGTSSVFRVLDSARLWDAYELQHQSQSAQMADWLETLFARHFMPAYGRETERLKRGADTSLSSPPPTAEE